MERPVKVGQLVKELGLPGTDGSILRMVALDMGVVSFGFFRGDDQGLAGIAMPGGVLGAACKAGFAGGAGWEFRVLLICGDLFDGCHLGVSSPVELHTGVRKRSRGNAGL